VAQSTTISEVNRKHEATRRKIVSRPERSDIPWKDIESLLIALGAEVTEGRGSRVRIHLNGIRAVFHRPHPQKETDKGAVKSVRKFLEAAED